MQKKLAQGFVETVFFTLGLLILCFYLNPQDPLYVHATFPWIWFLPVIIALHHGRVSAAIATAMYIFAMLHTLYTSLFSWDSYQVWLLGGVTITLICAEFNALWRRRQYGLTQKELYLDARLVALSRAYSALRFSHDVLEQSLLIKPATLRQALISLRELFEKSNRIMTPEIAGLYMDLLAYNGSLESAAIFLMDKKHLNKKSIAFFGKDHELNLRDTLVKRCIRLRTTTYAAINLLTENEVSDYLAVLPMETSDGQLLGLMTISAIPFISLNDETLKKLTVLLAYIADEISIYQGVAEIQKSYPDCPSNFANELYKLQHLWKMAAIDTAIVAFYLEPSEAREDLKYIIVKGRRSLDMVWEVKKGETLILMMLMPLTERNMLAGYTERLKDLLRQQKNIILGNPPILYRPELLSSHSDNLQLLNRLINNDG